LQEYDFEIIHIPGNTNISADALLQPPGMDQGENNNQDIVMLPLRTHTAIMVENPTNDFLHTIMDHVHNHVTHQQNQNFLIATHSICQHP